MKEIIVNDDNIKDEDVTNKVIIYNLLIINSNNKIIMNKHHNTYYFIHEYDDESIIDKYNIDINEYKPFLVRKKYILDYPLFDDKTLYENIYYKINMDLDIDEEYIALDKIKDIIEENRYDNPRNQDVTNEILEVLEYL